MNGFLRKAFFRIGMAGIADLVLPVFEQLQKIGTMRVMACRAHRLGEGRMLVFGSLHLLCLRMTGKTEVTFFRNKQMVIFRRVRQMAGETALLACDRCVRDNERFRFACMTADAELISALTQEPRVFR